MNDLLIISKEILKELINSDSFAPEILDEDVKEDANGYLVKERGVYVNPTKGTTIAGKKRFKIVNPERTYARSAVKFARELIDMTRS